MSFLIVACGKCGGFLLAKAEQKTRTCPYCGFKVLVEKTKKVASAKNAYEASEILRKLKSDAIQRKKNS
jgi:DNA-directed RNA polymerase subunit RPC12/RpoP